MNSHPPFCLPWLRRCEKLRTRLPTLWSAQRCGVLGLWLISHALWGRGAAVVACTTWLWVNKVGCHRFHRIMIQRHSLHWFQMLLHFALQGGSPRWSDWSSLSRALSLSLFRSIPFINSLTMHFVKGYVVSASPPNSSPGLETYYCGSRKIEILMILMVHFLLTFYWFLIFDFF